MDGWAVGIEHSAFRPGNRTPYSFSCPLLLGSTPVFLLDVSEDLDVLRSYLPAIPQQVPSTCVQQALIRHVGKHKTLCSHEI